MRLQLFILLLSITIIGGSLFTSCSFSGTDPDEALHELSMPDGFRIEVYAEEVENARSMAMGDNGILYVGTRSEGNVYAVIDRDNDRRADEVITIARDLNMPNGVAYRDGSLYVAEVNRILRYDGIDDRLQDPPDPVVITDDYPSETHHGWKYLAFGPDDKLYLPVGAPCNVCETKNELFATITRINPDGSGREIIARGVRNSVGFDWHPETGDLWFTDNGRDWLGDDRPPCELNHLDEPGRHFGYPYMHGKEIKDPDYGDRAEQVSGTFRPPAQELDPHVAPLGMIFYTGSMFPEEYHNQIFIAEHGSWNRSEKIGYRITMVRLNGNQATKYVPFLEGWLREDESTWGRPVDLLQMEDGSLLISDDYSGTIYRLTYKA